MGNRGTAHARDRWHSTQNDTGPRTLCGRAPKHDTHQCSQGQCSSRMHGGVAFAAPPADALTSGSRRAVASGAEP